MRIRRTPNSNFVFSLVGGTEDNDAWTERGVIEGTGEPVVAMVWEISDAEREEIAKGANLKLIIWGKGMPPVALQTTDEPLGKGPS